MRPILASLFAAGVLLAGNALAQDPGSVAVAAKDPHCLDLYDALAACADIEQEEQACADIRKDTDVPFNNIQALLEPWPKQYASKGEWFDHCRAACRGKMTPIGEFASKVCRLRLDAPSTETP